MTDTIPLQRYGTLRVEVPPQDKPRNTMRDLCIEALTTDGAHHKQWYLEQILLALISERRFAMLQEKYQWNEGIAP